MTHDYTFKTYIANGREYYEYSVAGGTMSILGERFFKLSNALFCYHLTPIQFTVYSFLVSSAGPI